jgi:RNA polymerase sigma-70 factor (ECF subfamily)
MSDPASITTSLLDRVRGLDDEGWRRLTFLYEPVVLHWCRRGGLQPQDADDVCQEVFRGVAAGIDRFRREQPGESFRGWLCTITKRKIADHWRRAGKQPAAEGGTVAQDRLRELAEPGELESMVGEAAASESVGGLYRRALELLQGEFKESTWKAFLALTVEERPVADVARELGLSTGAVYVAKSRVLKRLREELHELEEVAGSE